MELKEAINQFSIWRKMNVGANTVKGYEIHLRYFCIHIETKYGQDIEIEAIKVTDVIEYMNLMLQNGWHQNSMIRHSAAFRKFFEYYALQGYKVLPYTLIPIPRKVCSERRVVSQEEYQKLLTAIDKPFKRDIRNRLIIQLLYDTGVRVGELVSLDVSSVDPILKRGEVVTEKVRTGIRKRSIFWTDDTNKTLIKWLSVKPETEALLTSIGNAKNGMRITNKGVEEMLRVLSHKAGIPVVNPHAFRHRFGHDLAMQNYNNSLISSLMGHSSLMSSFEYTKLSGKELEDTARRAHNNRGH